MSYSVSERSTLNTSDESAVGLLEGLVAIPSFSRDEHDAVGYLVDAMNALGFKAHIDRVGNAVGSIGSGSTEVVLLGHIDTVPGAIPVRIEDGLLHGRGAVDAKGPLAAFVMAAARAAGEQNRITVVGAVGEEAIGSIGANEVATWPAPDYCIIGEPSGWDAVCLGYRGTVSFEYHLRQAARHTAGPGDSVAEQAVAFWSRLMKALAVLNDEATGFAAVGSSLRSFNTTSDGLYDTAVLSIGLRLPPAIPSAQIIELIDRHRGAGDIVLHGVQEGYESSKRTKLVTPFLREIRAAGGNPRFTKKLGTSDMNVVGPIWQCPIVAYGPGDSSLDHTPEEHIVIAEYLTSIAVLEGVLGSL